MTPAEIEAKCMLLGNRWYYDPVDHTFQKVGHPNAYCADTMDVVTGDYHRRCRLVKTGKLGIPYNEWWEHKGVTKERKRHD